MSIPLAEVGRTGRMDLAFAVQDTDTILRHSYCEIPFKITRVLNSHRPSAHLILMHCTAGLFGGDSLDCAIRVEPEARVVLTQQSATKVHPSEGRPAIQRTRLTVAAGGELQLYLEPVIPFADSCFRQMTQIEMQPGARLVFWEGFMAGRIGRGERWQFQELASETQLRLNDSLVYLDRFRLPNGFEQSSLSMGDCCYVGTGLVVGERARSVAAALREALPGAGIDVLGPDVVVVRAVSATGPEFQRYRDAFRRRAGQLP